MALRIYHQVGHYHRWNLSSFEQDRCGDGLILSPVHQSLDLVVDGLSAAIKARSIFDPQYYLPNSPKAKLATYPFFPEVISGGFSTQDFPLIALESATRCVEFQDSQGFESFVIPARFIDQMATRYFDTQEECTVLPFLKALSALSHSKPVYITLPLTSAMLEDAGFRTQLLNWVTGFSEIAGAYVLVADDRTSKQIRSASFLYSYMVFATELHAAGLRVIASHLNTEAVVLSLVPDVTLTFGSFENTRMFSLDKFIDSDEERRAPKPRIYLPALLNWIQYDQAMEIRADHPGLWSRIYEPTEYGDAVMHSGSEPYFTQPGLYKHHFQCMYKQITGMGSLSQEERFRHVRDVIKRAIALNAEIEDMPMQLDSHGNGEHLQPWLDAANRYYRNYIKA